MSKQSEKPIKEVFDYKEPFQAPQMVREITKKLKLRNAVAAQTIYVAFGTALIVGSVWYLVSGFSQMMVFVTLGLSWGMVELFNRVEPDGKKVHIFLKDYIHYLILYQTKGKVLQHGRLITLNKKETVYERATVEELSIDVGLYQEQEEGQ